MKILIVDDDVVARMVLMHLIDSALAGRCVVLEAEDGEDAWGKLEAGAAGGLPAMVFCDLRMPRLSGMELLARIKADARFAALPFVLASAAGDAATMQQALDLGAHGVIAKPFDGAAVAAQLARLETMGGAGMLDEGPLASARRLGIGVERLQVYLGGLERQLGAAGADIDALLAAGQPDAARAVLDKLGEGCRTLGLHGAAAALARAPVPADAQAGVPVGVALADARTAVLRQAEAVRRLRAGDERA
ncbi:response regulator [Massilia sp. 9096]|uniref:response regulator n=1 Tax=Massilia sp. 9096 TaxID=1500894 RepID=UPI0005645766|nr:response regulator [Massilia sp. 9096]